MTAKETWLTVIGLGVGLVVMVALGIASFVISTTPTVHRHPQDVPSVTQGAPSPKWAGAVEQARQDVRTEMIAQHLPGLSVAVGTGGEIVWAEGFGWADVEKRSSVTPASRFRIGHASKPLTSAAVGLLLQQGRLELDDEIQTHVSAFPRKQWPVTLRQLMGHVSGVRHYRRPEYKTANQHCERASDGLQTFAGDPLRFEPGTQSGYSTYAWVLVSAAVEAVAGESFFTFMRTKILEPLGMRDTTVDSAAEPVQDRVTFYHGRSPGGSASGLGLADPVDYSCFAGGGAFVSTPSDLVRFGNAVNNGTLLQRDTIKLLQRTQLLTSGQETEHGLGWMLYSVPLPGGTTPAAGHVSLTLYGGSTAFLTFPEHDLVVAVMTNISSRHLRLLTYRIAAAFAQRPHP
jgi:serine beta-lactamase-like protein LACTB, mitochondrial